RLVGIDERGALGERELERQEDGGFAIAGDEHVEALLQHLEGPHGAAGDAVALLAFHRGADQRHVRTAEDRHRRRPHGFDRLGDLHGRGHLRRRRRDAVLRGCRTPGVHAHDVFVVLDAREVEELDGDAVLFEHCGNAQDAKAHEDALVEQESRRSDHEADRRPHTNLYFTRFHTTRTVWYHLIFLPSSYDRP